MDILTLLNDWPRHTLSKILLIILAALILQVILNHILWRFIRSAVRHRAIRRDRVEEERRAYTLVYALRTVMFIIVWTAALVAALTVLNVNLTALITGAGAAGLIVGIVGQSVIRDYLAGFFIILENQCRIGDIVSITASNGVFSGTVETLSVRTTRLRGLDGGLHIIANGSVEVITNLTYKYGRTVIDIPVSYDTDLEQVENLINQTGAEMSHDEYWSKYIIEPIQFYRVDAFNESSITVKAIGKANTDGMQWMAAGEFRKRLRKAFSDNNIPLPNQNIVVHEPIKKSSKNK